jgi:Cu+-exporting ATPase
LVDPLSGKGKTAMVAAVDGRPAGVVALANPQLAEVPPKDKALEVRRLQDEGRIVGIVGDDINDAHALAQADIGLVIGTAVEAADLTADLLRPRRDRDRHRQVDIDHAQHLMELFVAVIYNAVGIRLRLRLG